MFKVVTFDLDESVFCLRVHYKSHDQTDCLAFVARHPTMDFHILDRADQECDNPTTHTKYRGRGACLEETTGNNNFSE